MKWQSINELCDIVRETSFAIHRYLKNGHLEKVYENALVHRLRKLCMEVVPQHPLKVYDEDGTVIGDYFADLFVENVLIVELKAARAIDNEHIAQRLGYLRSSRIETGLLINFGASKLYVKKFLMTDIDAF
ncbi:MAG TPA: GxxExxY protein [Gemmata sp.]|nr:GxxExxY protein [Gemmata sp.]